MATESLEQIHLFNWAKQYEDDLPELKLMFHIPNGGKRNITTAKRLKAEGVKAGVPDIFLAVARNGYHGLFIEMKVGYNKPTANQRKWLRELDEQGYQTSVCYSKEEAMEMLIKYLGR